MTAESAARVRFVEFEPPVDDPLTALLRTWGVTLDVEETLVWARHRAATLLVGDVDPRLIELLAEPTRPRPSALDLPPPPVHGVTARTVEVTPPPAPAIPLSSRRGRFTALPEVSLAPPEPTVVERIEPPTVVVAPVEPPRPEPTVAEPPVAEAMPEPVAQATPEAVAQATPEAVAEAIPEAIPEEVHEVDSGLVELVDEPANPPPVAAVAPHPLVEAAPPRPAPAPRRTDRFSSTQPVLLRYASWDEFASVYTKQISVGGMFVPVADPPPFGSRVTVRIVLPEDAGQIRLDGEVVHSIPSDVAAATGQAPGFGLQLDPMSDEAKSQLGKVVSHAERGHIEQVQRALHGLNASGKRTSTSLRITLTDLEATTIAELRRELIAMSNRDDAEVLGLAEGHTQAAVRDAFHRLAGRWHPSASARFATEEAKRMAMEIFLRIEQAYQRLSLQGSVEQPPARPAAPVPTLPTPAPVVVGAPESLLDLPETPVPASGRRMSQVARTALRARLHHPLLGNETARNEPPRPESARQEPEAERKSGEGGDPAALIRDKQYDEAIALLKAALVRRPNNPKTQVLLYFAEARKLVADKKLAEARTKYEALLALDPTHKAAQRDLVMLQCLG